jgi:hypothetical protein
MALLFSQTALAQKSPTTQPGFLQPPPWGGVLSMEQLKVIREKQVAQVAKNKADVKKILNNCHAATKGKDVNNRSIIPEVMSGMQCTPGKPTVGLEGFLKDIDKTMRTFDDKKIWDDASRIALDKSVRASLSLWHRFHHHTQPMGFAEAKKKICEKLEKFCSPSYKGPEKALIDKSINQFLANNKKSPIKYMNPDEQDKLRKQFNSYIHEANKTCGMVKKKYAEISAHYSCAPKIELELDPSCFKPKNAPANWKAPSHCFQMKQIKPEDRMTESKCNQIIDQKYAKLRQLESMAYQSININQQLIMSSELAPLLISNDFRKHVSLGKPDMVYKECMKGDGKVFNAVSNEHVDKAKWNMLWMSLNEVKTIEKKRTTNVDADDEIQDYLKTHPQTIADLLKNNPDPNYAKAICSHVREIHWDDKIDHIIDGVVIGVGVVAGLAFTIATGGMGLAVTGPVATTLAAISIGSTAIGVTKNAVDYHQQLREDQANRQAMATEQRNIDQGIQALEVSDDRKEALLSNMKWGAGGLVLEVAGLGFTRWAAFNKIAQLKKSPGLYKMVDGANDVNKVDKLAAGSKDYTNLVQKLEKTNKAKYTRLTKLTEDEQLKIAALFSKLDEAKGKAIVEKMAALDEGGLKKFFLMLDDLGTADLDMTKMMAKIDDFARTGTPVRVVKPDPWKKLSPTITADVQQTAKSYPETFASTKRALPKAKPEEVHKMLDDVRKTFNGKINDSEIGLLVERFTLQGAKTPDDIFKRFKKMSSIKNSYPQLFEKSGVLSKFDNESDMVKLAYLDELEKNGIPLRNADGEFIMSADGSTILRKKISHLTPSQRLDELKKEFGFLTSSRPCTL